MLQTYIRLAWRNLLKDRQFTLLNLLGLSTGLACSLLLYLWVSDELKVDKYNEKDSSLFLTRYSDRYPANHQFPVHTGCPCQPHRQPKDGMIHVTKPGSHLSYV